MTPLWKRVIVDKRGVLVPLAVALLANVLAYVVVVRPLSAKSAGAAGRASAAAKALRAAESEVEAARGLVSGKQAAQEELNVFYQKVLPSDLVTARRMTYASLPALARKASIRYEARTTGLEDPKEDERLRRMKIRMLLQGDYKDLCRFIYELESAREFIIIDDVVLAEGAVGDALRMTIDLSTYFREDRHAR